MKASISRILAGLLALSLAGATEVAQAWQTTTAPAQTQTPVATQQTPAASQPQTPAADQQTAPATNQQAPAAEQKTQPAQAPTSAPDTQNATPAVKENNASDPTHVPAPAEVLPNAPEATQQQVPTTTTTPATPATTQQPLGTAAAEKGVTRGGAASKPAGTAVAGKKQKQSRGLLIKVGAALAAGAALGTVYALSKGTSPTPPGATRPAVR